MKYKLPRWWNKRTVELPPRVSVVMDWLIEQGVDVNVPPNKGSINEQPMILYRTRPGWYERIRVCIVDERPACLGYNQAVSITLTVRDWIVMHHDHVAAFDALIEILEAE